MTASQDSRQQNQNRILDALPTEEYQRLVPYLELVSLPIHKVVYEPGEPITHVYFPYKALVSLVSNMEDGSVVEVGLVGSEGMVGIPVFLGSNITTTKAFVQVADGGVRMETERFKVELKRGGALQNLLLQYTQMLLTQVSQTAACNRLHTVEERLARWLLTVSDRLQSDQFLITQEFIAQMLGTRRSGVTVAAGILIQAGMISYTRGKITIVERKSLESTSCECYQVVKNEFTRLLGIKSG